MSQPARQPPAYFDPPTLDGCAFVRCADCRHAIAAPYDEPGAWRLCAVGGRSGWALQDRVCELWTAGTVTMPATNAPVSGEVKS